MSFVRAARRSLPAALLLALALPAGAQAAATMSVSGPAPPRTLTFTASDGLDHDTTAALGNGHVRITDLDGIAVGASGCTSVNANTVDCGAPSGYTRLIFGFGAGQDTFDVDSSLALPVTVDGGAGRDMLDGGSQADVVDGGDGDDDLYGNGGADVVRGGPGNDEIGGGTGIDTLDGGDGNDAVGAWDEAADSAPVHCGAGSDTVDYDYGLDTIDNDCETLPPHIVSKPLISGEAVVGATLTRSLPGTAGGTPTESYTYWQRCDQYGWDCWDIPAAEGATYMPTADDRGMRIGLAVLVGNAAGYDGAVSDLTAVVGLPSALPEPIHTPAPIGTVPLPRPPASAFLVQGPAGVAIRGATATVSTGRTVTCPAGGPGCRLSATARPAGASAKVHGAPKVAGVARASMKPGATAKITIRLTPKAARLLRRKGRLTLGVSAVLKRGAAQHAASSFAVTVKAPARRR